MTVRSFIDIDLLDDFFNGTSRNNHRATNGRIFTALRLDTSLRALAGELRATVRSDVMEFPLQHKQFWVPLLERHKMKAKIADPNTVEHDFVKYFISCSKKHKQKLFSTLEEQISYY